jgi:hypothetical protein
MPSDVPSALTCRKLPSIRTEVSTQFHPAFMGLKWELQPGAE